MGHPGSPSLGVTQMLCVVAYIFLELLQGYLTAWIVVEETVGVGHISELTKGPRLLKTTLLIMGLLWVAKHAVHHREESRTLGYHIPSSAGSAWKGSGRKQETPDMTGL